MSSPFRLVQLSDPHIGADWAEGDPTARLAAAVDAVLAVGRPDAVLVSGDLADHATDEEYDRVRELLAPLDAPLHVLPGNHDDRGVLRRQFDLPGADGEPVQYSADLGPVRLVVLDSTRPGEDPGSLDRGRLEWLDAELAAAREAPTIVAMHHPPILTGSPVWDDLGLPVADRTALRDVIARHRQVRRVVAGHVHRTMTGELAGTPVLTVPSTYVQARLNFDSHELELTPDPAGFGVHVMVDGELTSHVEPVR
jgi:3',5'-cyclic AMP phosphodiesterase CpdA